MAATVVALPEHWRGVLPAAALPALRAAGRVFADPTVPDEVVTATGAERLTGPPADDDVVLTCDGAAYPGALVAVEPSGARLLDAVAVMDRLRSPGGCPWDAEQTHTSLLQYLVEECYELYQAVEDGDRVDIREELGDVLLQVLFHARIATEAAVAPFGVDEVAGDLVAKLVGRHPHVFAGTERMDTAQTDTARMDTAQTDTAQTDTAQTDTAQTDTAQTDTAQTDTAERQEHRWEELKRAEKKRGSSVDGVPLGQPAVALAAKLTSRTARAGFPAELLPDGAGVGEQLFATAAHAKLAGIDPEAELRTTARRFDERVRAAERAARADGHDPATLDADAWRRYWG